MNSLFASTARGLEELLKTELESLGAVECQVVQGGVHFQGDTRLVYQSLMWSRLASRIILPLGECKVYSDLDLYLGVQAIDWTAMFNPGATFAVHFSGLNDTIRNSQYGAMKVKDAIVDAFTRKNLPRPNVDRESPDIRVNVWLNKDTASIALDLSGDGLHLRGYRDRTGLAPIKETLAAAIVMRSGWQPGTPLLDPMCGSGTLLIEAAMWATDRAPGLHRGRWGFSGWAQHDDAIWQDVKAEAQTRARKGLAEYTSRFYGSDSDARVIERARSNARRAGIGELITFEVKDVAKLSNPLPKGPYGTVISNPPYGERLDSEPALIALHSGEMSMEAVGVYLAGYLFSSLGAFGVVSLMSSPYRGPDADSLYSYRGLFWHRPILAAVMTVMMLSLAGIPMTLGFIGKFYVLAVGVQAHLWWLVGAVVVGSAIGLYYYLRVAVSLYLSAPEKPNRDAPSNWQYSAGGIVVLISALLVLVLGIYPQPLISIVQKAMPLM